MEQALTRDQPQVAPLPWRCDERPLPLWRNRDVILQTRRQTAAGAWPESHAAIATHVKAGAFEIERVKGLRRHLVRDRVCPAGKAPGRRPRSAAIKTDCRHWPGNHEGSSVCRDGDRRRRVWRLQWL